MNRNALRSLKSKKNCWSPRYSCNELAWMAPERNCFLGLLSD